MTKTGTFKDDPSYGESPVFSPDLRQIAYVWDTGGKGGENRHQLRVMPSEPGGKPRVLADNPEITWYDVKSWSPDGKSILAIFPKPIEPDNLRESPQLTGQSRC